MGRAITIHPTTTGDPCIPIPSTGPGRSLTGLVRFGTRTRAGITSAVLPMVRMERWGARPGITPSTGRYGRAATAQTWYGGRTAAAAYNPWTGGYGATRQGHSPYAQWGRSAAVRGDDWARSGHVTTARGTVGGIQSSQGSAVGVSGAGGGTVVKGSGNNVYAGKDGNVYRKDSSGNWSKYEGRGNWDSVDTPSRHTTRPGRLPRVLVSPGNRRLKPRNNGPELGRRQLRPKRDHGEAYLPKRSAQLDREASARQSGEQRASQQRQYERSGGWSSSSSRGGGGGWSRGGGGRRGGGRRR